MIKVNSKNKKLKYRKAVFVVLYSIKNKKIEYLVLKRKLHWIGWEFPKGGKKFLEPGKIAAKREVKEETGLRIIRGTLKKYPLKGKYEYSKEIKKRPGIVGQTWELYSAEVKKDKVDLKKNLDFEHSDYRWVNFKEAIKKLKWKNQKECIKLVNDSLR